MYYYGVRYYDPRISIFISVDPLAEQTMTPYQYVTNNPIMFTDPTGMEGEHIDPGNILSSKEHASAFVNFATTKEGKQFLDKYASKGQEFSYNGSVFYSAEKNGEYHDEGINLNYKIGNERNSSSASYKERINGLDINIEIAKKGLGLESTNTFGPSTQSEQNKTIFNIVNAIAHESFMHADSKAADFSDDRMLNKSNLPAYYRNSGNQSDHFYFSHQTVDNPNGSASKAFNNRSFDVLKKVSERLNLNLPDATIKGAIWKFDGSRVKIMPNGSYKHR